MEDKYLRKQKYNKSVIYLTKIRYKYVISGCFFVRTEYNDNVIIIPQNHNKSVMENKIWNDWL